MVDWYIGGHYSNEGLRVFPDAHKLVSGVVLVFIPWIDLKLHTSIFAEKGCEHPWY